MTGLVIVSHSRDLAQAAMKFAKKVCEADIPITYAGGVEGKFEELGTDATDILAAIERVYSEDGVLVLMDMGSAIMSAEMALEFLGEERAENVKLLWSPIVEGSVAAVVQISMGASLDAIIVEANDSLSAKMLHIKEIYGEAIETEKPQLSTDTGIEKIYTIINLHGLHARPAAKMAKVVGGYNAQVSVYNLTKNKGPVSGKSLNKLATLGVVHNNDIKVTASGLDAEDVVKAIDVLIKNNFGESLDAPLVSKSRAPESVSGIIAISEGFAIAKAHLLQHEQIKVKKEIVENREKEIVRLHDALETISHTIDQQLKNISGKINESDKEIFEAHKMILCDPDIVDTTIATITSEGYSAAYAFYAAIQQIISDYESMDDEYLSARAVDVRDVGNQVLCLLTGKEARGGLQSDEPVIIFARELTPSETASLNLEKVKGVVTEVGGTTSHTAILARSLGIPAISGYASVAGVPNGATIVLDGCNGTVFIDPVDSVIEEYNEKIEHWQQRKKELLKHAHEPAMTKDHKRITVMANIGNITEAHKAIEAGAEGIGLLRTEFIFLERDSAPAEEEQYKILREIGTIMGDKPVVVRTFDIGGDKVIPYLALDKEENPFLGVRGVRLYAKYKELFVAHIRAILRAGFQRDYLIMLPMVSKLEELREISQLIRSIHRSLEEERIAHLWPIQVGIMIETPSAAMLAEELAQEADFFSIGTNDLTQYVMAAERGNAALNDFSNPLHPSVLRTMERVIAAAREANIPVSICGELGATMHALPLVVGMGIEKLSMIAAKIPEAKQVIQHIEQKKEAEKKMHYLHEVSSQEVEQQLTRAFTALGV